MKKTYLSYEAPEVELVEMAVECGFAASLTSNENEDANNDDYVW